MCPLYPLHVVLLYLCLLLPLLLAVVEGSEELFSRWRISFIPKKVNSTEGHTETVEVYCDDCFVPAGTSSNLRLVLTSQHPNVASLEGERQFELVPQTDDVDRPWTVNVTDRPWKVNVTANFLGFTEIQASLKKEGSEESLVSSDRLPVSVTRVKTIQSKMFGYSVAVLISIAYVNMGCAMDLGVVKEQLRLPIGPAIGFACQFVVMPLLSFALGYIFDSAPMRLGLFVTGTSPGGGASNIWTLMFGGNLNLSVTMTAISTFAAFIMMPAWIFTLGTVIFSDSDIIIPYYKICTYAVCLVVPLSIGLLITRYLPRVSKVMVRVIKPMALFLILFILIFGVWANLYMFKLMDWRVIIAGMGLPWLGFAFGCTLARLCRCSVEDVTAIAIETGVQNTGMSIFILWFTLDHPLGDIAGEQKALLRKGNMPYIASVMYDDSATK